MYQAPRFEPLTRINRRNPELTLSKLISIMFIFVSIIDAKEAIYLTISHYVIQILQSRVFIENH